MDISARRGKAFLLLIGWIALMLLLSGCGLKAPPVAPQSKPLAAVTNLQGELDEGIVKLTWDHSPENWVATVYAVLRAQKELNAAECADCPLVFQKAGSIPVPRALRKEKNSLDFSLKLAPGFRYTFSVRPVHSSGAQGPDSNLVVIEVTE